MNVIDDEWMRHLEFEHRKAIAKQKDVQTYVYEKGMPCPRCNRKNCIIWISYKGRESYSCLACLREIDKLEVDYLAKYFGNRRPQSSNRGQAIKEAIRRIKRQKVR